MECNTHRVMTVTNTGTTIELTLTDSTNIGDMERFNMVCKKTVGALVTTAPIPVTAVINGASVSVRNIYGQTLLSDVVPWGPSFGRYIVDDSGAYLWLKTPRYA